MFDFIDARRHYVFVSCLVQAQSPAAATARRPASPSRTLLRVHLAAEHRRWCPRIAQFVLFVIKIPNAARAARGAGRNSIETGRRRWRRRGERDGRRRGGCRTARERRRNGVGFGVFSVLASGDYLLPSRQHGYICT